MKCVRKLDRFQPTYTVVFSDSKYERQHQECRPWLTHMTEMEAASFNGDAKIHTHSHGFYQTAYFM